MNVPHSVEGVADLLVLRKRNKLLGEASPLSSACWHLRPDQSLQNKRNWSKPAVACTRRNKDTGERGIEAKCCYVLGLGREGQGGPHSRCPAADQADLLVPGAADLVERGQSDEATKEQAVAYSALLAV
ncbi:MAG: hypothetical protein FRX49_06198 [Trebouxia sp. A1-2]|nr:MAG: hypothetical protein FRX49_06198 [Trebouxia sp. A1-2]